MLPSSSRGRGEVGVDEVATIKLVACSAGVFEPRRGANGLNGLVLTSLERLVKEGVLAVGK